MKRIILPAISICLLLACNESGKNTASLPQAVNSNMKKIPVDANWTTTVEKTDAEWKKELTADQYYITRQQGTERPFTSEYTDNHESGLYFCVCCHNPLFSSTTKFNSGTGWPSFFQPYSSKSVNATVDNSDGMERTEISCKRCHAHLGHVFDDGPAPTGLRYCMDGVALVFQKQ